MEIKEMPERKTIVVKTTTSVRELPAVLGGIYGELMGYLQKSELSMTGPPFVLYRNADMEALQIEAGFPVDRAVTGEGRIEGGAIPGGRVLSAIHTGSYATLEKTYTPVMTHIEKNGLKVTPWMYELYLNSPDEVPEEQLQTEICFPLES